MQNLKFTKSALVANPASTINSSATQIFKKGLDLSQTSESVFKDDEPLTPFSDPMMDTYNPFVKDPDLVHTSEDPTSGDKAALTNANKTE